MSVQIGMLNNLSRINLIKNSIEQKYQTVKLKLKIRLFYFDKKSYSNLIIIILSF